MRIRTVDGWTDDQAALAFFLKPGGYVTGTARQAIERHNAFMALIAPLPPADATQWDVALWNAQHPDRWTRTRYEQYRVTVDIQDRGRIAVRQVRGCGSSHAFFDSVDTLEKQIDSYVQYGKSTHCEGMKEFYAEQVVAFREALKQAREATATSSTNT